MKIHLHYLVVLQHTELFPASVLNRILVVGSPMWQGKEKSLSSMSLYFSRGDESQIFMCTANYVIIIVLHLQLQPKDTSFQSLTEQIFIPMQFRIRSKVRKHLYAFEFLFLQTCHHANYYLPVNPESCSIHHKLQHWHHQELLSPLPWPAFILMTLLSLWKVH